MCNKYDTVIGLEIHAELSTNTKAFCTCDASFGGDPNTHICPVCTGQPGALPIINHDAVAYAIRYAKAHKSGSILACLSGRGDKDIDYVYEKYGCGEQFNLDYKI